MSDFVDEALEKKKLALYDYFTRQEIPDTSGVSLRVPKQETDATILGSEHAVQEQGEILAEGTIESLEICPDGVQIPEVKLEDNSERKTSQNSLETVESSSGSSGISSEQKNRKKDGSSDDENDFEIPDKDLEEKITRQVESYFTDFNVMKDSFLLKHIRRNKEGYISLKLVSSFRKVKTLTKDWRVVRYCLRNSKKLQVNEEGTKVRRIQLIPTFEETSCAKMVLVFNIPLEKVTSEDVMKLLLKYGEITEVTVVEPGSKIPEMCTKRCLSVNGDLVKKTFALVEFKNYESAQKVIAEVGIDKVHDDSLKVAPLLSDVYKSKGKSASDSKASKMKNGSKMGDDYRTNRRRRSAPNRFQSRPDQMKPSERQTTSSHGTNKLPFKNAQHKELTSKGVKTFPIITCYQHYQQMLAEHAMNQKMAQMNGRGRVKQNRDILGASGDGSNPWMNKRQMPFKNNSTQYNSGNNHHHRLPENVIRWPRGPDGTIGFHQGRRCGAGCTAVIQPGIDITDVIKGYIASFSCV